jgi:hypothetical protein
MSGNGVPSASFASSFTLDVSSVEGQKQGLIFYGLDNSGFAPVPWGASTSFLCVKAPLQRTPAQSSGGSAGACDGALALDWNAYLASPSRGARCSLRRGRRRLRAGLVPRSAEPQDDARCSNALYFVIEPSRARELARYHTPLAPSESEPR